MSQNVHKKCTLGHVSENGFAQDNEGLHTPPEESFLSMGA